MLIKAIHKNSIYFLLVDVLLVTTWFFFFIWLKPASVRVYLPTYFPYFIDFLIIWIPLSLVSGKYSFRNKTRLNAFLFPVLISSLLVLALISYYRYFQHYTSLSRLIVFGTVLTTTFFELNFYIAYYYYRKLKRETLFLENQAESLNEVPLEESLPERTAYSGPVGQEDNEYPLSEYKDHIVREAKPGVYEFIAKFIDPATNHTLPLATTTSFNINVVRGDYYRNIINLSPVNDIKRLNLFFEAVNHKLPIGGIYFNCVKTNEIKKNRIFGATPPVISHIYYFFYFTFWRLLPKLPYIKKIYFLMTNGFNRSLSKAETFGRLYSCGFEVVDELQSGSLLYFAARKIKTPCYDKSPTYGPLISLNRLGKMGNVIHVYKLRTMHPFSEYLQEYVFKKSALQEGGKFKNDFRVSTAGRIFRKCWVDELPMLINLLKGDIKLVGVRPISKHYFSLYSTELQELRIQHTPGLIPPFYADLPKTLDEIMASEVKYLEAYTKNPLWTDWTYFWMAVYNIVIKRERSN